jgi:Tol biopolymer transport system component
MRRLTALLTVPGMALFAATALTTAGVFPAHATAPGRNGRISFRRYTNDAHTRGDIFTINADGTEQERITHAADRGNLATEPDWAPGGGWISYDVWKHGDDDRSRIFKIRPNGSERTNIDASCTTPCLTDGFQQWSPDGVWIAFQRSLGPSVGENNVVAIFVMRADGTDVQQVTQQGADPTIAQPFEDNAPTWSPTDGRLAFVRRRVSTGRSAIFTVRPDGNGLHQVTPWRVSPGQPDWSPDGRWIAFYGPTTSDIRHISIVHPDGSGLHIITSGTGTWGSLSFSPNGRKITASHSPGFGTDGNADVYTMNVDGTDLTDITNSNHFESAPDWGPRPT